MSIENIKLFKNGRIGGYINSKGWRFLSNFEVDNIMKQNMKGGDKPEIYSKLKNILDKKIDSYKNIGQFFKTTSKKRKTQVSELRTKINTINKNNNAQLNNIITNTKHFFNNSKKINNIKKNANKLFTNYNKYLMGSENNLCEELTKTPQHKWETLGSGAFGEVKLIKYNNKTYAVKIFKNTPQDDIKDEYKINKLLFNKCNYLLKQNKLIGINYNFIIEPICLNNDHIFMEYGGEQLTPNKIFNIRNKPEISFINNYIIEQIKNIILNLALLQISCNPIFLCSDLKLTNMVINKTDETFQIKLIDIGGFCRIDRISSINSKCPNPFINNECLLNSDKIEFDNFPIYNTFDKHKRDLFIRSPDINT